ncbi:DUF3168 domain-containing protein [Paracoccus sp. ME4]|uniref:DUF3168 domain-containing protein n=1 Tax=Paracoccus sp. ME4 TaxID=3138066 RepID=UPI00398A6957
MSAPSVELQGAIYAALKGDAPLMALISDVYDRVQRNDDGSAHASVWGAQQGYISFGPEFVIYEDAECLDLQEVNLQIDVWSRQVGRVHCKRIVAEARRVLLGVTELTDNALVLAEAPLSRITQDPDGLTTRGIIEIRYEVEGH